MTRQLRICSGIDTIFDIVRFEHICGRNDDNPHLVECNGEVPELVAVLHHEDDEIALLQSLRLEVVACLVAEPLDVSECECLGFPVLVCPYECSSVGIIDCDVIYYVILENMNQCMNTLKHKKKIVF